MPVTFQYQTRGFRVRNQKQLANWLLTAAFLEHKEIERIDYVFCDDAFLLSLNKQFLHHHTLTDIITFDESTKHLLMAEIYISVERVKDNAAAYGVSFNEELLRVMIHGMLHCMGYNDKSEKDKKKMRRKENEYLKLFGEEFIAR